ncbi:angiomotin [Lingula anatina]|uniref:Angiomotin n=1 Tax=Lingula anatina TaxID=7574 RepID=A0A1S3HPE6_LINAN|nr:angiomotin [Lingula anatina]|eukprot:XP_013387912.1 angiomotin [Lingula anatina]
MQVPYWKDPPPYPGHLRNYTQPGYRQSYSGSEASTDISLSSNENLSTSARQDPQGEENQGGLAPGHYDPGDTLADDSILARLGMPPSVEVKSTRAGTFYITGRPQGAANTPEDLPIDCQQIQPLQGQGHWNAMAANQRLTNLIQSKDNDSGGKGSPAPTRLSSREQLGGYVNDPKTLGSCLPPPPRYPGPAGGHRATTPQNLYPPAPESRLSQEMLDRAGLSRSQQDITTQYSDMKRRVAEGIEVRGQGQGAYQQQGCRQEPDHAAIAERASQLVELLSNENRKLKEELEGYYKKVSKLQKFELEIQKIQEDHEGLVKSSHKREQLEKAMRVRMEGEVKKLQEDVKTLRGHLQLAQAQLTTHESSQSDAQVKQELERKEASINKLLEQNKEMTAAKERLDIELAAQRSTLQEQRKHIDILDNALTNAQANVVRLEEELKKKDLYVERVEQLQKALTSLQTANQKREQMEKSLREKLENEIKMLKSQKRESGSSVESFHEDTIATLTTDLRAKEEKILDLESQLSNWEQKYLEEIAMREIALDEAATPKDARIAALETNTSENEKLLAEAQVERLKSMEELYKTNRRCAELEARVKTLQAQVAEKDAMVRVLQKSASRSSSYASLFSSPRHSPRPSVTSPTNSTTSSRQNSQLDTSMPYLSPKHAKSASTDIASSTNEKESTGLTRPSSTQALVPVSPEAPQDHVSQHCWQV